MRLHSRRKTYLTVLAATCAMAIVGCGSSAETSGGGDESKPIRIGTTLALTGPLAPTAIIHKVAGEQFVKNLNAQGGLLGRQVEWVVLDDQSSPEKSAALYERLISEDKVDLVIGPYGTGNITAAMQVAKRHEMFFPHNSGTLVYAYNYKWQFPLYASGIEASKTGAETVFDAYAKLPAPPKTVGFVNSKFAATNYLAYGHDGTPGAEAVAKSRGLNVVLDVQYDLGNTDWGPLAARVKQADPDLLYMESTGAEGAELIAAMQQLNYKPRHAFYQFPAPGPMLGAGKGADLATSTTLFEPYEPYLSNPGAKDLVKLFPPAAEQAGIKYSVPDYQAALAWAEWQTLVNGVKGCNCLTQEGISEYLLGNVNPTVLGDIKFDAKQNNYYGDLTAVKQIQDGKWVVVYPADKASNGTTLK